MILNLERRTLNYKFSGLFYFISLIFIAIKYECSYPQLRMKDFFNLIWLLWMPCRSTDICNPLNSIAYLMSGLSFCLTPLLSLLVLRQRLLMYAVLHGGILRSPEGPCGVRPSRRQSSWLYSGRSVWWWPLPAI